MDLLLWAYSHAVPSGDAARVMEMTVDQVERVYRDIESKRRVARQLDSRAVLIESHPEMEARP
jgi:NAD+ synthase